MTILNCKIESQLFMNKLIFALLFLCLPYSLLGQNIQFHYDFSDGFGKSSDPRGFLTTTLDFYKSDSYGSSWWFVDFDFSDDSKIGQAYFEIARDQKIGNFPLLAHIEFNGGLYQGAAIDNSFHSGIMYPFDIGPISFETALMYRYTTDSKEYTDSKIGISWYADLLNGKISLIGFFNMWTQDAEKNSSSATGKNISFISEPQIWYNINDSFSIGSEIEFSYNFLFDAEGLQLYPTVGLRLFF